MKKHGIIQVAMVICLILTVQSLEAYTDEEIWARLADAEKKALFQDDPTIIIFDEVESRFKPNGANISTMKFLVKIQDESASSQYATLRFDFNELTSNVIVDEVKIFRKDGATVESIDLEKVQTLMAPDDNLIFWNFQMRLVPVGKLNKGDALYYQVRRKGLNLAYLRLSEGEERDYIPPMPGHFFDTVYFQAQAPMLLKKYVLYAPPEKPVQYELVHGEVTNALHLLKEGTEYIWEKKDVPAYKAESDASSFNDQAVKLVMATNPDWEGKSRWAYEVNEPQFIISPEMQAKVDELTHGLTSDYDRMAVLLHWVAENVRYLGLDMGKGEGFTVHPTDQIFSERAGVCKDKAAVLVSMLRAAGYKTYFVLTLAMEQAVDIPADQFNHGVVAVQFTDGSFVYLDPTWAPRDRALFNKVEQEQPILVATEEGRDLEHVPYSPPEENFWHITSNTSLAKDGSIRLSMNVSGDNFAGGRMRDSIEYRNQHERLSYFYEAVYPISSKAVISDYSCLDTVDFSKPMHLSLTCSAPDYSFQLGDSIYFVPPLSRLPFSRRWESNFLYVAEAETRTNPLELDCTREMVYDETISIPAGYVLEKTPDPVSLSNEAVSFEYKIDQQGKSIKVYQKLVVNKRILSPDEYPTFREIVQKMKEIQKTRLKLVKK
ncbi:DUF3857 domain-containing protein [bacterium]|nr:DUF3857 domain-containing protein [bacterium]